MVGKPVLPLPLPEPDVEGEGAEGRVGAVGLAVSRSTMSRSILTARLIRRVCNLYEGFEARTGVS